MAFDGTWKVERSENYDKFMEKMGKGLPRSRFLCFPQTPSRSRTPWAPGPL